MLNGAYDLLDQVVDVLSQAEQAAKGGDVAKLQELGTQLQSLTDKANATVKDYGFKVCGTSNT